MALTDLRNGHRSAVHRSKAPQRSAGSPPFVPLAEWTALRRFRPNVLIEGNESDVEQTLVALMADFGSVRPWTSPAKLRMHTIVVRDVFRLRPDEQQRLLQSLDDKDQRIQVIATSTEPLYRRVRENAFRADLYYRLTTLRLVVGRQKTARP